MTIDMHSLVRNDLDRVVSVEPLDNGTSIIFRRLADGSLEQQVLPFKPWLLLSTPQIADVITTAEDFIALEGDGFFKIRAVFPNAKAYETALKELKLATGKTPTAPGAPYRVFSDSVQQFLTSHPARLFGGMDFTELRRMQLDIETLAPGEAHFPDASRPEDAIFMVSLRDSTGWEDCLVLDEGGEASLLRKLVAAIRQRDPDVIEGHNIFNFDLAYITARCKRHGVPFAVGRDGSQPKHRNSQLSAGERTIPFTRFDIFGRHVVDTLHATLLYDVSHRDMDSHSLKKVAQYFHVAAPDRTYIPGDQITRMFQESPDKVRDYCMDDARETDAIAQILLPSFFYQTQLIPLSYQSCITRGNATRIDALLCAEYVLNNASLPVPQRPVPIQGALTEGDKIGIFRSVWHVDVRSLYPSIIASRQLTPESDWQGVFLRLLTGLRQFRLAAKDARRTAATDLERNHFDALQGTFKILINAFYGYTAFTMGTFNDYAMAAEITATGRDILGGMRDFLEGSGATVVEMDTDGIYFTPPPDAQDGVSAMQSRIQATLPPGIEVEIDACYEAMFGYKSKNYALLKKDGSVAMSGAALKSRGAEAFQRRYIRELVELLLTGRQDETQALYETYRESIENHSLPLSDFAKREYLSTSLKVYAAKLAKGQTKHSAAYDLAIAAGKNVAQGDAVDFYVTGNKKSVSVTENSKLLEQADDSNRDENVPFYLNKLQLLHQKLLDF